MGWPLSQDYNEAVQNPASSFADRELRGGQAACNGTGIPMPRSGNFADVYEFIGTSGARWAVKCFTRDVPHLQERYDQIDLHLLKVKPPMMVDFQYQPSGIRIRGQWYPILRMQWVEGLLLNEFVRNNLDEPAVLERLGQVWLALARHLRGAEIAHGDLQHGNILLVRGPQGVSLRLVDYDGMWVPALASVNSGEVGHSAYQHPQRVREGTYDAGVDRTSLLVVACALRCLSVGGWSLWHRYDNGDNLLFREADLQAPAKSALFQELLQLPDPKARMLAAELHAALTGDVEHVPGIDEILSENKVSNLVSVQRSAPPRKTENALSTSRDFSASQESYSPSTSEDYSDSKEVNPAARSEAYSDSREGDPPSTSGSFSDSYEYAPPEAEARKMRRSGIVAAGIVVMVTAAIVMWAFIVPEPKVTVSAEPSQFHIFRGETKKLTIRVQRQRYDGPIRVTLTGLPDGVTAPEVTLAKGKDEVEMELTAAPTGNAEHREVDVTALATNKVKIDRASFRLSVTPKPQPSEVILKVEPAQFDLPPGGTKNLTIKRTGHYDGPIHVKLIGLPPEVEVRPAEVTLARDEDKVEMELTATLFANGENKEVRVEETAPAANNVTVKSAQFTFSVRITPLPEVRLVVESDTFQITCGEKKKFTIHRTGYEGSLTPTFSGLPGDVKWTLLSSRRDVIEVELEAARSADFKGKEVTVTAIVDDRKVRVNPSRFILSVFNPEKEASELLRTATKSLDDARNARADSRKAKDAREKAYSGVQKIVDEYPGTKAAEEAKGMLETAQREFDYVMQMIRNAGTGTAQAAQETRNKAGARLRDIMNDYPGTKLATQASEQLKKLRLTD